MLLKRNVPGWERIARIAAGLVAAAFGALWLASGNLIGGVIVIVSGLGFAATGIIGWCPLCAMVGRTLPKTDRVLKVAKL
jgi:hypothetical protein